MNYKLIIAYDGTRYDGWQKQGNTANTIQGKIEGVLERMAGQKIEINGAGRTDSGVHANMQVANVHMDTDKDCVEIHSYLNKYLPEDIAVTKVETADERFHARLSASGKIYTYRLEIAPYKNVFERKYIYFVKHDLNIAAMRSAAKELEGMHDFKSFCANKRVKKSTVRTLHRISIEEMGNEIHIICHGDGFLHHMVRIIIGTLLEVGMGKRSAKEMQELLLTRERSAAGFTAPAEGLILTNVLYS